MESKTLLLVILSSITIALCSETMKIDIIDRPKECSQKAKSGDKVSMHYDGVLSTGKPFDSSRSRNSPFGFQLGVKQVISCWDEGIPGMCVGEKRKLTCPPAYAYGDRGFGDIIPAKSTLVFEVELLAITESAKQTEKKETKKEEAPKDAKKVVEPETDEHDHDHEHEHSHADSFESVDKDGNGEISREEMATYIQNYQPDDEKDEDKPSEEEMQNLISEIFQADDTNKDGVLSKEEYYHGEGEIPSDEDMAKEMELGDNEFKDEL